MRLRCQTPIMLNGPGTLNNMTYAEFGRQVHQAFDELVGHETLAKGLWDVQIASLRVPGTTKLHAVSPDTAYAAVDLAVEDMMRW